MHRRERPSTAAPDSDELDALVVLGCRVRAGEPSQTLARRLQLALDLGYGTSVRSKNKQPLSVVVSGGRAWEGKREADVMADWLMARGVPRHALILETESLTTRENARKVAVILEDRRFQRIGLVTSDFHMRRAAWLFRREGTLVTPFPAPSNLGFLTATRVVLREICAHVLGHFER